MFLIFIISSSVSYQDSLKISLFILSCTFTDAAVRVFQIFCFRFENVQVDHRVMEHLDQLWCCASISHFRTSQQNLCVFRHDTWRFPLPTLSDFSSHTLYFRACTGSVFVGTYHVHWTFKYDLELAAVAPISILGGTAGHKPVVSIPELTLHLMSTTIRVRSGCTSAQTSFASTAFSADLYSSVRRR